MILFDADNSCKDQTKLIRDHLDTIKVDAKIFLFPNNKQNGELETLLMKLANWEDKAFFLTCYDSYLACLNKTELSLTNSSYRIPDYKDMFQAYSSFFRMGVVDFYDEAFWNFSRSEAQPLKDFLSPLLK